MAREDTGTMVQSKEIPQIDPDELRQKLEDALKKLMRMSQADIELLDMILRTYVDNEFVRGMIQSMFIHLTDIATTLSIPGLQEFATRWLELANEFDVKCNEARGQAPSEDSFVVPGSGSVQ